MNIKTHPISNEDILSFTPQIQPLLTPGVVLDSISVPESQRGRGLGNQLLQKFVNELDQKGLSCILDAFAYEMEESERDAGNMRLANWYAKFGFKTDPQSQLMYRLPTGRNIIKSWILNNCRFASMTVSVGDYQQPKIARTVFDLTWAIQDHLWPIIEKSLTPQELEQWRLSRPMELLTIDGDTGVDDPEGVMNLYTVGLTKPVIDKLVAAIGYFAPSFGGVLGKASSEPFSTRLDELEWYQKKNPAIRAEDIRVVRFPTRIDASKVKAVEFAPEINMANGNARFIFQDVLGYPSEMLAEGYFSLDVNDLLMKLGYARTMLAQRLEQENAERAGRSQTEDGKVKIYDTPLDMEGIEQRLNQIEEIAQWAKGHGYSSVSVG